MQAPSSCRDGFDFQAFNGCRTGADEKDTGLDERLHLHGTPPLSFAVVDLETTGASAIYDRIVEVAVVRLEGGEIVDRYELLVDPKVAIPPFITRLTGIDGG